ncbi:hypothetical protein BpHYR1_000028 [Brachionus plicatilis]|uniref:Secreted protein n=1 Tax=Brachionus plicatilis TaxID=10195 RepID=A0A3M7QKG2_BRAPC|nr:hypothetical protein BpHYR1_000028 [Brachionus plicatilis]
MHLSLGLQLISALALDFASSASSAIKSSVMYVVEIRINLNPIAMFYNFIKNVLQPIRKLTQNKQQEVSNQLNFRPDLCI